MEEKAPFGPSELLMRVTCVMLYARISGDDGEKVRVGDRDWRRIPVSKIYSSGGTFGGGKEAG